MIDSPITKKFFRKLELYLELKRQDKRVKKSDRGKMIWTMEKHVLLWAVRGHWYLGTSLTPGLIKSRLVKDGFKEREIRWTRQVMQNLMARDFAYHPENEKDIDTIQIKDKGFLMGEVIEEAKSKKEYIYILFSFSVWLAIILAALKILSELVKIIAILISGWVSMASFKLNISDIILTKLNMEILALMLSPVIAVAVGEWLRIRNYKKMQRDDLVRRLLSYGYQLSSTYNGNKNEILTALNEIKYQYSKREKIKEKTFALIDIMQKGEDAQDKFVELMQTVARAEGYHLARKEVEKVFSTR